MNKKDNLISLYNGLTIRGAKTEFKKFWAKEVGKSVERIGVWFNNEDIPESVSENELDTGINYLQNARYLQK